jgi:uncharacterized protein YqiB (DUF1249 family)
MISDSYIVPECVIGRGSFGGLMALYESNFIKFNHLVGRLGAGCDGLAEHYYSKAPTDCDLFLSVESRSRYTRDLRLTYRFTDEDQMIADPDLIIRVYLDARMTEVAGWAAHHQHAVLRGLAQRFTRELDKRWSRNMMLSKWLYYLMEKGHSFREIGGQDEASAPTRGLCEPVRS